jgi:hypothetical protein
VSLKKTLMGMHSICTISLLLMTGNNHSLKRDDNSCNKAIVVIDVVLQFFVGLSCILLSAFRLSSSTMFVADQSMQYFCMGRFAYVLFWLCFPI